ncbi:MAG TPA: sialidase family protein [Bryobacteraceae bacterium]|nr:sialidase family protein [Bryobacteraceae bacterium]
MSAACAATLLSFGAADKPIESRRVQLYRVPEQGIQPQVAIDRSGNLHLAFYSGDARSGNVYYVRSADGGATFSIALRVNSQEGSAVAAGTIRGAQIAFGKNGRIHVAWNGSMQAEPKGPLNPDSGRNGMPMLYARLDDGGAAFEPQRNLMRNSYGLDGGGSIAADTAGNVYVAWHGLGKADAGKGEGGRQVWIARSRDEGKTWTEDEKAWQKPTGACGCCGMKIFADPQGGVHALYRSATESVHRDTWLLSSGDKGKSFDGRLLHKWDVNACPMSSMDFAANGKAVIGAWETGGQVYWARIDGGHQQSVQPITAPGEGKGRKHPRVAVNHLGDVLLVWTEGTGWQRGGSLAWQVYALDGRATSVQGQTAGVPVWSFGAAAALPDGRFTILY